MITDPRLRMPKAHQFPDVVADKRHRIYDPHVAPLNQLVEEINAGRDAHHAVPHCSPRNLNSRPEHRAVILQAMRRAAAVSGEGRTLKELSTS